MLKFVNVNIVFVLLTGAAFLGGCSSGEYEIDEYKVDYEEKTIIADTIKKVVIKDDPIKEDIKKDTYTYIVQIGAFAIPSNFDNFYQRAKQVLGDGVYYEQTGGLYKIRIGSYSNRLEALKYVDLVRSKGYTDAFVITRKN
jgi:cell division protein FtsN